MQVSQLIFIVEKQWNTKRHWNSKTKNGPRQGTLPYIYNFKYIYTRNIGKKGRGKKRPGEEIADEKSQKEKIEKILI